MDDNYSHTACCCFLFIFRNISCLWLHIHLHVFIKNFVCFIKLFHVLCDADVPICYVPYYIYFKISI